MAETLGIFVTSDQFFSHLTGLVKAASDQGKEILIFLTGRGVLYTKRPEFEQAAALADITLCRVSLEEYADWTGDALPGVPYSNISTQAAHAALIHRADRYIAL